MITHDLPPVDPHINRAEQNRVVMETICSEDWERLIHERPPRCLPNLPAPSYPTAEDTAKSKALEAELAANRIYRAEREADWAESRWLCVFVAAMMALMGLVLAAGDWAGWLP